MAYRFTNSDKWSDSWFYGLKNIEKLLFIYLCDNCDYAGFIEVTPKRWGYDLGVTEKELQGAIKGLERCYVISADGHTIYLKNFLKHQKNLPINSNNKAHFGIIKRMQEMAYKFNIEDISDFLNSSKLSTLQGVSKGLDSPTGIGIGIGNGIGKGKSGENENSIIIPDLIKVAEYVSLYPAEIEKLKTTYGENNYLKMVDALDNYKGASGKKYKSDYRAILTWVAEKVTKVVQKDSEPTRPIQHYT